MCDDIVVLYGVKMTMKFRKIFAAIRFLFFSFLLVPLPVLADSIDISGRIDDGLYQRFRSANLPHSASVSISSIGGNGFSALDIAGIVKSKELTVRVTDVCFSACAEFILPAARQLNVGSEALIGFHESPEVEIALAASIGVDLSTDRCLSELIRLGTTIGRSRSANALMQTIIKLGFKSPRVVNAPGGCRTVRFDRQAALWFPTSQQLREVFGLPINGPICADNPECINRRLAAQRAAGQVYVVG
jgi:hypothetical protein